MGFKEAIRASRKQDTLPSPPTMPHDAKFAQTDKRGRSAARDDSNLSSVVDPDLVGKQPKRSASFGRSFGGLSSITNGMSQTLSRKSSSGTSTPPVVSSTNLIAPVAGTMGPPGVPESSHLAQFSLKLSELVNRAFSSCSGASNGLSSVGGTTLAGAAKSAAAKTATAAYTSVPSLSSITYEGRKLPSKAVISEIALVVVAELEYAASVDPYLLRAVSRQALKALTPFADRIDSLVIHPSKDPSVSQVPTTAKEGTHLPAALEYNLGLVSLEYIVEDALEHCIEGDPESLDENDGMPSFVSEILTPVRKKMEGTILHVIQPILTNSKASLASTLAKAVLAPFAGYGQNLSPATSNGAASSAAASGLGALSPPIAPPTSIWLRELEGKVDGTRKMFVPRLVDRCGQDGEGWFISVVINTIWKGLLTLTSRSMPVPAALSSKYPAALGHSSLQQFAAEVNKRAPSPAQLTTALKSVSVVGRSRKPNEGSASVSGAATPVSLGANALGSSSAHAGSKATSSQLNDLQSFERVMRKFASGFSVQEKRQLLLRKEGNDDSTDSDSDEDDEEDELARAACTEALQAIRSTVLVAQWLDVQPEAILDAATRGRSRTSGVSGGNVLPADVVHAAKAIPPLLLLQLIYARMPTNIGVFALQSRPNGEASPTVPPPPAAFGYTWSVYEKAISGFAGGQTWALALTEAWRQDIDEAWEEIKARDTKEQEPSSTTSHESGSDRNSNVYDEHSSHSRSSGETDEKVAVSPSDLLHLNSASASLDPSQSTPTPASMAHRIEKSTSPMTSAGNSCESLPEHMTRSAPNLHREREETVKGQASLSGQQVHPERAAQKERPTWNFIRKASSRKQGGSETNSPPHPLSPNESPPQTPGGLSIGQVQDGRSGSSARRFWRASSSQNVTAASAALASQQHAHQHDPRGSGLSLPAVTSLRGNANVNASVTREGDRLRDESSIERDCLRLLERALDAVKMNKTASPSAQAS